jgi:hypothetical protein
MHYMLGTIVEKVTTMVADLQKINNEQQDCLYKLEVMAGIKSANVQPSPLPTMLSKTATLMQLLLETMDVMSALHPNLQRIVDEQQLMSMDVLPALHPDLQWII